MSSDKLQAPDAAKRRNAHRVSRMKSALKAFALGLTLVCAACSNPQRSRDLNNPKVPAAVTAEQVCANCHGSRGNAVSPNFPRLAGQQKEYFAAQLKGFRSHGRSDSVGYEYMWGLSRNLTDAQIEGLAAYYAEQKSLPNVPGNASLLAEGKGIFDNGLPGKNVAPCSSCHGPDGMGNGTFPRLAGQHADYLTKQLTVFQKTEGRPEGAVMKTIVHDLSERDLRAVAAYLQGL